MTEDERKEAERLVRARAKGQAWAQGAKAIHRIGGDAHAGESTKINTNAHTGPEPAGDYFEEAEAAEVSSLNPLPENDRIPKMTPERREALRASMLRHGIRTPLIVDKTSRIVVCGNNRLSLARELEWSTVPVLWRNIPEAERVEYAIRDNAERRQMTEAEISRILAPYLSKDLPEALERTKKARADALAAVKRGETPAPIPSAYKETAKKITRETGVKMTPRALKRRVEKTGGGFSKKPREKPGVLQKPAFKDGALKMILHFPNRVLYEKAKADYMRHYLGWTKAKGRP